MKILTQVLISLALITWLGDMIIRGARTDGTDGKERSGLIIYLDYGTGVEYVGTPWGGLTARVDANGKPMIRPQ